MWPRFQKMELARAQAMEIMGNVIRQQGRIVMEEVVEMVQVKAAV